MAFRTTKGKKYKGISEYFNAKSNDKAVIAYYVTYRPEGSTVPIKRKLNAVNKDDALIEANQIRGDALKAKRTATNGELQLSKAIKNKTITLKQLAEIYFEVKKESKHVEIDKKRFYNRVPKGLYDKAIAKITTEDLITLRDNLSKTLSPKTSNDQLKYIAGIFNYAIRNDYLDRSPFKSDAFSYVRQDEHTPGRVLSDDELQTLFNSFEHGTLELLPNQKLFVLTRLLYLTGARPDAILSLKVQDIDFVQSRINLKAMKLSKGYAQTIREDFMPTLRSWIDTNGLKYGDYLFFPSDNPKKRSSLVTMTRMAHNYFAPFNVGIPTEDLMRRVSFYTLRRTAATKVYRAKGLVHASAFLHHTSVKTTMLYLNVSGDSREVADVL